MVIVDRTKDSKNQSGPNVYRFFERIRNEIDKKTNEVVKNTDVKNFDKKGVKVRIRSTKESTFEYDASYDGWLEERTVFDNDRFVRGDIIEIPVQDGQGSGEAGEGEGDGSDSGTADDADDQGFQEGGMEVIVPIDVFLDILFPDFELPNIEEKLLAKHIDKWKYTKAGYTSNGVPANLDLHKSYKNGFIRKQIVENNIQELIDEAVEQIKEGTDDSKFLDLVDSYNFSAIEKHKLYTMFKQTIDHVKDLQHQKDNVPFFEDMDLKYRNITMEKEKISSAVIFCILDVSASMDEPKRKFVKGFYTFLYLLLSKFYKDIEVEYLIHTDQVKNVSEQEFFDNMLWGATKFAPAVAEVRKLIQTKYPPSMYNIYVFQATDGELLYQQDAKNTITEVKRFLGNVNMFYYLEVTEFTKDEIESYFEYSGGEDAFLSTHYDREFPKRPNFKTIRTDNEFNKIKIVDIFKKLFDGK